MIFSTGFISACQQKKWHLYPPLQFRSVIYYSGYKILSIYTNPVNLQNLSSSIYSPIFLSLPQLFHISSSKYCYNCKVPFCNNKAYYSQSKPTFLCKSILIHFMFSVGFLRNQGSSCVLLLCYVVFIFFIMLCGFYLFIMLCPHISSFTQRPTHY